VSTAEQFAPTLARAAEPAGDRQLRIGVICGIAAYGIWGLAPIYFRAVRHIDPLEVLAHRVVWSVAFLFIVVVAQRRLREVLRVLSERRVLAALSASTILVGLNWLLFIWAVGHGQTLQASLGYFINPLLNVVLGYLFLGERLRRVQKISVAIAAIGVGWLLYATARLPAPALAMATTFAFYGLVRKTVRVDALIGLSVETALMFPLAVVYLLVLTVRGQSAFVGGSAGQALLLASAGLITSIPLLLFTHAARRLRLATVGILQYIAPTGQFLLAVLAFGEPFDRNRAICFAFIWVALAIYTADAVRTARRRP
jgi:chloramphenicol-sensitive protein RarD